MRAASTASRLCPARPPPSKAVPGGTVIRIGLQFTSTGPVVMSNQVIATGFGTHTDPNALVVGPTGWAWGPAACCTWPTRTATNSLELLH